MRLTRHIGAPRPRSRSLAPRASSRARSGRIALAACAAAGLLTLTGCDLLPSDSGDPTPAAAPTRHRTPPAAAPTTTGVAPTPTEGSEPATATPSAEPSAPGGTSTVAATRYSDKTSLLQLPVSKQVLPEAPAGLVDFARTRLTTMWHEQFQDELGCMGIAQVRVKRTLPTSAYVEASWGDMTPTCPQYAGNPGWWEVWSSDGAGSWSVALKGEGTAACSDLVAAAIPRSIYPSCSDGTRKVPNPVA